MAQGSRSLPHGQGVWVACGKNEPSMWNWIQSMKILYNFFFFCSVLCLFLSVYRHEDFDCLSTSPLGSFSLCPTFSPPLFTYVVVFFFLPSALSLFLPVNICLTQTLSFSFDVLVLLFTYCFVWSTRRRLFLWKSWKAQREHINNLL